MGWGGGRWRDTEALKTGQEKWEEEEGREEEEAVRRERRETCHQPDSGSSAAASFVDSRWRGLEAGPDPWRAELPESRGGTAGRSAVARAIQVALFSRVRKLSREDRKVFPARAESGEEASCGCAQREVTHSRDPKGVSGEVPGRG